MVITEYLPVPDLAPQVTRFVERCLGSARNSDPRVSEIIAELMAPGASSWAAVADGEIRAVFGAELRHVEVGDPDYTYMPARYALISPSRWHLASSADWAYAPDLLDHIARDAIAAGIDRLSIEIPIDEAEGIRVITDGGFTPDVLLAARGTRPGNLPDLPGVRIRMATEDDADALLALTLEEANYHAEHTRSGIVGGQDPEPSRAHVATWLENQRTGGLPTFVAEDAGGVVGMLPLVRAGVGEGPALPVEYGYIASTCITARARGRGIGGALVEHAFAAAHERGMTVLLLHYVADNPLAAPFWEKRGFAPLTVTFTRTPLIRN